MEPPATEPGSSQTSWLRILIVILIVVGITLTAFYGARLLRSTAQLRYAQTHPRITDVGLIRGWMTIHYISRAYRVPENVLFQGLRIPEDGNRHKSLRELDRLYAGGQPGVILGKVRAIVQTYQEKHPATPVPTQPTQ